MLRVGPLKTLKSPRGSPQNPFSKSLSLMNQHFFVVSCSCSEHVLKKIYSTTATSTRSVRQHRKHGLTQNKHKKLVL